MNKIILTMALLSLMAFGNSTIINLPANSWYKVPNSQMNKVCPSTASSYGCRCVMTAWNGGAFNENRDELVVFGGGHNDYDGNEIYVFKIQSLSWERITDPSYPSNRCREVNSDNTPVSRHTYNGLAVIGHVDRFFALGGALDCGAGGCGADETWTFDFGSKNWQQMNPGGTNPGTGCGDNAAYDSVTKKVYFHGSNGFFAYDYDANSWTRLNGDNARYYRTTTVDYKRRLIVEVGRDFVSTWDLTSPVLAKRIVQTTGGSAMVSTSNPGVAYDPVADKIVCFKNGPVYVLDLDARTWAVKNPSGGPTEGTSNGIYGRWRYVPSVNAFVLALHSDSSVYFYKHTAGMGTDCPEVNNGQRLQVTVRPNPFNTIVNINYELGIRNYESQGFQIKIYDTGGKLLADLTNNTPNSSFLIRNSFSWNPRHLPNGIYLLKVQTGNKHVNRKLFLIR
jgi:hypothetical protein